MDINYLLLQDFRNGAGACLVSFFLFPWCAARLERVPARA